MKFDAAATIRDQIDELYRSESRPVFASLVRLLMDFDLADDAMHEAYAAAIESWKRDEVPANPRAWLISTGKFKAINSLHRQGARKRTQPMPLQLLVEKRRKACSFISLSAAVSRVCLRYRFSGFLGLSTLRCGKNATA